MSWSATSSSSTTTLNSWLPATASTAVKSLRGGGGVSASAHAHARTGAHFGDTSIRSMSGPCTRPSGRLCASVSTRSMPSRTLRGIIAFRLLSASVFRAFSARNCGGGGAQRAAAGARGPHLLVHGVLLAVRRALRALRRALLPALAVHLRREALERLDLGAQLHLLLREPRARLHLRAPARLQRPLRLHHGSVHRLQLLLLVLDLLAEVCVALRRARVTRAPAAAGKRACPPRGRARAQQPDP